MSISISRLSYDKLPQSDTEDTITLRLKPNSDTKEYELKIDPSKSITISELKSLVIEKLSVPPSKNVRLIHSGKLLDPDTVLLSTFRGIQHNSFIHVALSDKRPTQINTSSGRAVDTSSSPAIQVPSRSRLSGLDILLSSERDDQYPNSIFRQGFGLSADEVAALRSSFRSTIDQHLSRFSNSVLQRRINEDELSYRQRVETHWLESLAENSEFVLNLPNRNSSTRNRQRFAYLGIDRNDSDDSEHVAEPESRAYNEYMLGFMMGFFLGFVTIFCIWDSHITKRQKIGILAGISLQVLLNSFQTNALANKNKHNSFSPTATPTINNVISGSNNTFSEIPISSHH